MTQSRFRPQLSQKVGKSRTDFEDFFGRSDCCSIEYNGETNQITVLIHSPHKHNHFFDSTWMACAVASSPGCKHPEHRDAPGKKAQGSMQKAIGESVHLSGRVIAV